MARRRFGDWRRHAAMVWGVGAVTAVGMTATSAPGQSERSQIMVMDDGSGPQVLHLTQPDLRALREPDYVRSDLPIFTDMLRLSETQTHVVKTRLEAYLEAFKALAEEMLPPPRGAMTALRFGGGGDDAAFGEGADLEGGGEGLDAFILDAFGEEGLAGIDVEVDDMGGGGAIAVTIEAGAGGPVIDDGGGERTEIVGVAAAPSDGGMWVADGGGGGDVAIAIESSGDLEISDEMIERLEKKAQALAERMQNMEFDGAAVEGGDMMFTSLEESRAQHEALAEQAKKFRSRKTVLASQFVSDVQAQLSAKQLQRWPNLERTLTRRKSLPKGRLDGERTDLIDVVERLEPPVAGAGGLDEQLEAYEHILCSALTSRDAYLENSAEEMDEAIAAGDTDKALSIADRAAALRVQVRNVNEQYREAIGQQLAAEDAERFREAALRRAHPRLYRPTYADRAFRAAAKLPDLGEETRADVAALEEAHRAERDALNAQIRQTILRHQPAESRRGIEHVGAMLAGGGMGMPEAPEDPIRDAYARRRDLDERFVRSLHGLLTPEQVAQLPSPPKKRGEPIIIRRSGTNPF